MMARYLPAGRQGSVGPVPVSGTRILENLKPLSAVRFSGLERIWRDSSVGPEKQQIIRFAMFFEDPRKSKTAFSGKIFGIRAHMAR
jgi:hypothetical protein